MAERVVGIEEGRRDALVERMFESSVAMMELIGMYIGDRLGFYEALAENGWTTSVGLADAAGASERYAREWLEQQYVAGVVEVEDARAEPKERRYHLPSGHAEVLLDADSLSYMAPLTWQMVGLTRPVDGILAAFRDGGGVEFTEYGKDMRDGISGANRALFVNLMAEWLASVPDLHERLSSEPPARVADIGCGSGWSSISIARAYPKAFVDGFDLDEESVASAGANAGSESLEDRVSFEIRDASDPGLSGRYDLAIAIECIHDMSRPVEALRAMRSLVGESGAAIVVDEKVPEKLSDDPGDEMERLYYGFSILHCLPVGMAEKPSAETGTVMRPDTLRDYALAAGFSGSEILPIENDMWRFYRLRQ